MVGIVIRSHGNHDGIARPHKTRIDQREQKLTLLTQGSERLGVGAESTPTVGIVVTELLVRVAVLLVGVAHAGVVVVALEGLVAAAGVVVVAAAGVVFAAAAGVLADDALTDSVGSSEGPGRLLVEKRPQIVLGVHVGDEVGRRRDLA